MEAPALCFLSAKPIQIEKLHRSDGIWQVPDSDRYKTDSNLRQILLILRTYTVPTQEHSAPLPKSCHLHTAKSIVFNVAVWGQNRFYLIGTSIVLWGALQTKIKPIQSATCKLACGSLRPIQNRQQSGAKSYLSCVPIHSHSQTCTFSSA